MRRTVRNLSHQKKRRRREIPDGYRSNQTIPRGKGTQLIGRGFRKLGSCMPAGTVSEKREDWDRLKEGGRGEVPLEMERSTGGEARALGQEKNGVLGRK